MHLPNRVHFEQPDLNSLCQDHTVVDFHFHSSYSDGLNRIDKIADRARSLGIGIAITDHNDIRGAVEMDTRKDVFNIPGIELTSAEGSHLLVYFEEIRDLIRFFEKEIMPFRGPSVMSSLALPMAECIDRARQYNCLIIFPHPYCAVYTGVCNLQFSQSQLDDLFQMVDGVEVINASSLSKWNLKCAVLGFNLRKGMVGGSDGHALSHMGRAVTCAPCPPTRRDFLSAVSRKENLVIGKEISLLRKITTNSFKFRTNLYICEEMIEKNIRYGCKVFSHKSHAIRSMVQRRINGHRSQSGVRINPCP